MTTVHLELELDEAERLYASAIFYEAQVHRTAAPHETAAADQALAKLLAAIDEARGQ